MLPMQLHQFKRFMLNLGFVDEFIVKRMFETFDVDHHEYLNFVEVPCCATLLSVPHCSLCHTALCAS